MLSGEGLLVSLLIGIVAGWLADHFPKPLILGAGYLLAAVMALAVMLLPMGLWTLAFVFVSVGVYVAVMEALEDSLCAELVEKDRHGMAFGVLATVNGLGDFLSSVAVGVLWTAFGTTVAFGYTAVLSVAGAILVFRLRIPAAAGT